MKIKLMALVTVGLLSGCGLQAQTSETNALLNQTVKYQMALEHDRLLGEKALLPPGLKAQLNLTSEQKAELKPIEEAFAVTCQEYQATNQALIDAAVDANRTAREAKDVGGIVVARRQLQEAWAGLQPYRAGATKRVEMLLTPTQVKILNALGNQWHENHVAEGNDPSAN
jgi:hypothetical protein